MDPNLGDSSEADFQVVPASELGKVFGLVAVCGDLANMTATLVFNSIYSPLRALQPGCQGREGGCQAGLAYLVAGGLLLVPGGLTGLAWWWSRGRGAVRGTAGQRGNDNPAFHGEIEK